MFNLGCSSDIWVEINTGVTTCASFVSVYYCFTNSINLCFDIKGDKEYYLIGTSLALSLVASYGPVYSTRKSHLSYEKFPSLSEDSSLEEPLIPIRHLTHHERFILFGIGCINLCNAVFPLLFVINNFVKESTPRYAKITLLISATLIGGVSSVAPLRSATTSMLSK